MEAIRKFRNMARSTGQSQAVLLNVLRGSTIKKNLKLYYDLLRQVSMDFGKADKLINSVSGNEKTIQKVLDARPIFTREPINPNRLPSYFLGPRCPFSSVNWQHILGKHSVKHFDFDSDHMPKDGGTTHMFVNNVTQTKVAGYISQALGILSRTKGSKYPLDKFSETVILPGGLKVIIGAETIGGKRVIGQFYPKSGPNVTKYKEPFLRNLKLIY